MDTNYLYTTSNPALGAAPLPSSQVGQYVNQQIVGAQNRETEGLRNLATPQTTFNRETATPVGFNQKPDQVSSTVKAVESSNKRLANYAAPKNTGSIRNVGGSSYNNTYSVPAGVTGTRAAALRGAASYLGSRYVLGGTSRQGIDCSGLVMQVYNQLGFNITRHSATWQRDNIPGVRTNDLNQLRPGDIVAWKDGSHIAVYAGNGEIIEAANERVGTVRRRLWDSPSNVIGIKLRFPGE